MAEYKAAGKIGSPGNPRRPLARYLFCLAIRVFGWLIAIMFLWTALLSFAPIGNWLCDKLIQEDPLVKADYIIVLGGRAERAVEAARLYREGWAPKVICSSAGDGADSDADIARMYGVPAADILLDRQAVRTASHPGSVAQLPGVDKKHDRFIVVTSPYHTSRAKACFLHDGYIHVIQTAPAWRMHELLQDRASRWWCPAVDTQEKAHEVQAWGVYKLLGWL